jgi:HPt (histidine-containing phosphotransfer) domain-containing protein
MSASSGSESVEVKELRVRNKQLEHELAELKKKYDQLVAKFAMLEKALEKITDEPSLQELETDMHAGGI